MRTVTAATLLLVFAAGIAPARDPGIRPPAVAGRFYSDHPGRLRAGIEAYLDEAVAPVEFRPVGLLAPHAGYVFSGQIAADAWNQVQGRSYDVVVILGTNHTTAPFAGASVYPGAGYRTPLGTAEVAQDLAGKLLERDGFQFRPEAHPREHSVEVQVPFAQVVLPKVPILPMVVGSRDPAVCRALGEELGRLLQGRKALLVASSDLSHYPDWATAVEADTTLLAATCQRDPDALHAAVQELEGRGLPGMDTCACGEGALQVMLTAARAMWARRTVVLSYANSGDGALGDRGRVVGYGALALTEGPEVCDRTALVRPVAPLETPPLDSAEQGVLLEIARETIARYLATETTPLVRGVEPRLTVHQGAFVTLKDGQGALRGCIGHMSSDTPLAQVVGRMALQAAFNDRRFDAVAPGELDGLHLEISVLTPRRPVSGPEEIVVGRDGVVIERDGRSAVFLPQVAVEQGWDRDTLLTRLCHKAGLPPSAWREPDAILLTFQAQVFAEAH